MEKKYKVFISRCDIPESTLSILKDTCELDIWPNERNPTREELLTRVVDKDGLFVTPAERIDRELLKIAGGNLKVVSTMSAGYDHFDVQEMKLKGIRMGYTSTTLVDAVAELTVALLLSLTRRLFEGNKLLKDGLWHKWETITWMNGMGLKDSVVGIIGLGHIGLEVAKRLRPFKVKEILYTSRTVKKESDTVGAVKVELDDLLRRSDVVIVTCALTEQTKGLLGDREFEIMKNTAVVVNTSRGSVIDQDALVRALKGNKIAGAALDVMVPEPLPTDHELLTLSNCCLVPHIGSAETKTRKDMADVTAKNLLAGLEGREMISEIV